MSALSRPPVRFVAVAVVYFLASRLGTAFFVQPENLSVFWPAGGLLLGYLLATERREWRGAVVAAALGNLVGNVTFGHAPAVSVGFAAVNAVEPLAVAWLIEGVRGGKLRLDRTADVFLLFAAPLGVCAVTALAGAGLVTVGLGAPSYWGVWKVWWLADALGAVLFAPLVLALGRGCERQGWPARAEFGLTLAALAALTWAVFGSDLGREHALLSMPHPVFPLLLWAALRSDLRGVAVAVVAVGLVATAGTLRGHGPFGTMGATPATEVLVTQGFVATVCLSSLVLAVAMGERRAAEERLRGERQVLRTILDSMGDAVLVADAGGRMLLTNAAFDRLHADAPGAAGRPPGEWSKAFGVYLSDGTTLCPAERLPIFRAARGEGCDDERLVVVNGAHPDGAHISVTGRPVVGPAGVEAGVITIRDITPALRAEAALVVSEQRFRAIFHSQFQFIGLMRPDGVLLEANDTAVRGGGLSAGDVIGRPFWETGWWAGDANRQARLEAAVRRAAAGEFVRYEADIRGAGGGTLTIDFSIKPYRDASGAVVLLIPEGRDITERKKVEAELRLSEERFRTAFDHAPIGIALVSPDGRWLRVNKSVCDLVGYAEPELLATDFQTITHPDDLTTDLEYVREMLAGTRDTYQMEKRYVHKRGHTIHVLLSVSLVRAADGAPLYFVSQIKDITERKEAERAVQASEERYRVLFEHSSDAHLIFDDTGIIDCNNAAVAMLRCADKRQVLALHPAALSPEFQPDGRRSLDKCVDMDATARRHGYHRFDWLHRRFDGEVFPCEVTLTPVELHGRAALLVVWHDLTERMVAEAALRDSEERFRAAMEGSLDAVYFLAAERAADGTVLDFRLTELNGRGAALVSRAREDVLGRRLCELLPVNRTGGFFDKYVRVAETGEPLEEEFPIAPADGLAAAWLRHQVVRVGDGVAITTQDITARKAAEERVRASLREEELLLKEIHHRVKNNLQIVSTLLDLQSDYTADPGALEMFRESRGRVKSMALVHERLYRSDDVARVNFAEYVRQLADDLYHTYRITDIHFELIVDIPPLPIDIAIPCGLLLNELMSNCFKHAFKDADAGVLRVSLTGGEGANVLVVADDGAGFPPEIDFRNTASFGLQLVNTLVEQLGGSIELTSSRGTVFTVRFASRR